MKLRNLLKRFIVPTAGVCALAPIITTAQITFAEETQVSAAEAVSWVRSLEGQGIDFDGNAGNQCVDLIKAYYNYLGETAPRGNANTYAYNEIPDGWERIEGAEPQVGDILVYTGGAYGHVAAYTGENESYHQNWSGAYVEKVTGDYRFGNLGYWGVIRPDFADSDSEESYDYANVTSDVDEYDDYTRWEPVSGRFEDRPEPPAGERPDRYGYGYRPDFERRGW